MNTSSTNPNRGTWRRVFILANRATRPRPTPETKPWPKAYRPKLQFARPARTLLPSSIPMACYFAMDFGVRGHAAMWAARQKIYEGTTPRRRQQEIPPELVDESIKPIPLLAKMSGKGYPRLLAEAKAGLYGELYQLGKNSFGLKFGNWKRGMAARIVK